MSDTQLRAICVIAGLGLIVYGGWGLLRAWRLRRDGIAVQGHVVRVKSDGDGGGFPVVAFSVQGRSYEFTSRSRVGAFSEPAPGATVAVRYAATKPADAVIDSAWAAFRGPAGNVVLGTMLATIFYVPYFALLP